LQWPGCFSAANGPTTAPFDIVIHLNVPAEKASPSVAPTAWTQEQIDTLFQSVSFTYPHSTAIAQSAKATVSALRRRAAEQDEEAPQLAVRFLTLNRAGEARERGVAMHAFLQHHDPAGKLDVDGLHAQAAALVQKHVLSPEQREHLDLDSVSAFWKSDFGREVRSRLLDLHRELPFTVKLTRADLAQIELEQALAIPENEFVIVQGIADLVVLGPEEIWLLDFKTDQITPDELAGRTALYRPQLAIYALALERIYQRPVRRAGLYFLALREFAWVR